MTVNYSKSLTPLYVYPKICKYTDKIDEAEKFVSPLNYLDTEINEELLIYIHIPFCKNLCLYCAYYKEQTNKYSEKEINTLVNYFIDELRLYSKYNFFSNKKVKAIQFGGGTPSDISTELIAKLISAIHKYFDTSECKFIGLEGNASSLNELDRLIKLKSYGVTKISFGIQTFNETIRKKLNINAKVEDIYETMDKIKKAGIHQIAVDIMYNLPDQNQEQLLNDIKNCIALRPEYIDLYGLNIFPNTYFKNIIDERKVFDEFPDDKKNIEYYQMAKKVLLDSGYNQSMVFTFTRNGLESSIYERLFFSANVLGIGPSARSYLNGLNFRNYSTIEDYRRYISKLILPIECGNYASEDEKADRKTVFFPNLLKYSKQNDYEKWKEHFAFLIKEGLVKESADAFELTDEGCIWPGNISRLFFSNLQIEKHNSSFFESVVRNDNPYNQDKMGIMINKNNTKYE